MNADHTANIERIIEILKADTSIYSTENPTGKLRKIFFAETDYNLEDDSTPYAYVRISDRYQYTRESVGSEKTDFLQSLVEYQIVVVLQKKDAAATQKQIHKFTDLIIAAIKANPKLKKPSDSSDPKAIRANVADIRRLESQRGMEKDGAIITIQLQLGSGWQVILPGSLTLDLLSVPEDSSRVLADLNLLDDGNEVITRTYKAGTLSVEFESDFTLDASLEALLDGNEKSVTFKHGDDTKVVTAFLRERRKGVPFDNIDRTILLMDVI